MKIKNINLHFFSFQILLLAIILFMKNLNLSFLTLLSICIIISCFELYLIRNSTIVYAPILLIVIASFFYGFKSPQKGWIISIVHATIIILGYFLLNTLSAFVRSNDISGFITAVSIFPIFVGAYLGSFVKRI